MLEELVKQIAATSWVEWLGTLSGITGVWLSIRERIAAWPLFITCYASYICLSLQAGLHGALLMNAVFVGISIYGWICWSRQRLTQRSPLEICRIPSRKIAPALVVWAAGAAMIAWMLSGTGAYSPALDAFASSGGFVAQWMLSRKHIETWICWIISDAVFIYLWASQGYWLTVLLFTVFILLAIRGWLEWNQSLKRDVTDK